MPSRSPARAVSTGQADRWAWVVFALSLALTLALAFGVDRWAAARDRLRFEHASSVVEDRIRDRLDTHVAVLQVTQGLFVASHEVELEEFHRFAEQLALHRRYPGLQGLGVSRRLSWSDRAAVEAELRAAGQTGFEIWPDHERDEIHATVFLEPLDGPNRRALGFDLYTEPVRRAALERARDTGAPAASGPVTLVQEDDEDGQLGVVVYAPVYGGDTRPTTIEERRARLQGFVYAALRMGDLLADVSAEEPSIAFAISDVDRAEWTVLYRSPLSTADAGLSALTHLAVAGRSWVLRTEALPALYAGSSRWLAPWVLVLGAMMSIALAFGARARARLEGQLRLHSRVLESMSEGVSVFDGTGVIRYTNAAEDAMFGYSPGELVGRHVSVQTRCCPTEHDRGVVEEVRSVLRAGGIWSGEFSNVRKDGSSFLTSARITGLHVGGRDYWICVQEDITDQRRAEVERTELLERETNLRVAAEAASRAKDEFLAMLGHELRNPLAPIVTALELTRRRGGPPAPELAVLERQVRHLRRLVDDLLDVSRITRGRVVLERRRLEAALAVDLAVELASPSLEERGHSLVVDVPRSGLVVDADEARIVQVITNLLVNAAKYTEPGGHVVVRGAREGADVVLRVCDDGIGISPELMPRLFDLFSQGERGADRREGGLGIGLAVAKRIVELHGGTLSARSEGAGRGTEFEVRLPSAAAAVPNPAANVGAIAAVRPPRPGLRVLVVDDNRDAAQTLAELLRAEGYDVSVAFDGAEALEVATRVRFDVAILDLGLPVIDGYELARRLPEPRPALFAVTGYGRPMDRARSASAGFVRHFVKPVSAAALLDALAEHRAQPA